MAGSPPPFALFIIVDGIDIDYIDDTLIRVRKGNDDVGWDLYVATESYHEAPKKQEKRFAEGTEAPMKDREFKPPFIGKTVEHCAKWLLNAPDDIALNREYFLAINEFSRSEDTLLICRILDRKDGELEIEYYPEEIGYTGLLMAVMIGVKYDEALQHYQRNCMRDEKPDRSRGKSYDFPSYDE